MNQSEPLNDWITPTINIAKQATCTRSKCGSIIVQNNQIIGQGFNSPPSNLESQRRCQRKHELQSGFKSDRTCCIHAEQRAIIDALSHHANDVPGSTLYFIRLNRSNQLEPSGPPYCTICSKMALDTGISQFVLWHTEGPKAYNTADYNDRSFLYYTDQGQGGEERRIL
jgi:deoxycytidylate deaminase